MVIYLRTKPVAKEDSHFMVVLYMYNYETNKTI